jgi:hypothetical protein
MFVALRTLCDKAEEIGHRGLNFAEHLPIRTTSRPLGAVGRRTARSSSVTRRIRTMIGTLATVVGAAGLAACDPPPPPTSFVVNTESTGTDADPGDGICEITPGTGDCSLRAAIEEGNALGGSIRITVDAALRDSTLSTVGTAITTTTTIDGRGTEVIGGIVHTAGSLTLRDIELSDLGGGVDEGTCGRVVDSSGDALELDRIRLLETRWGGSPPAPGTSICARGSLTIVRSQLMPDGESGAVPLIIGEGPIIVSRSLLQYDGPTIRSDGAGPIVIANSAVFGLETGDASGVLRFSWVQGSLNDGIDAAASILNCTTGSSVSSSGFNIDVDGLCGAADPTDHAPPENPSTTVDLTTEPFGVVPTVGSTLVGAVPAGTPGLCDGTIQEDVRGEPRTGERPCDIGPYQTQATVDVLSEHTRETTLSDDPVRINGTGTIAATFVDEGVASVGRWEAGGAFIPSDDPDTAVADIADSGLIVGSKVVGGVTLPWRWQPDHAPEVVAGPPGTTSGRLFAVNDVDQTVVGSATDGTDTVLWHQAPGGPIVSMPVDPSAIVTAVHGGIAVGHQEQSETGETAAMRWDLATGTTTELARPTGHEWGDAIARDIAADGTIVGSVDRRPVVWSPTGAVAVINQFPADGIVGITSAGDLAIATDSYGTWIVPAGTADLRLIESANDVVDIGDDGTLVSTTIEVLPGGGARKLVVRRALQIGD